MAEDWLNGGFGVYVHWPFCAAKCPYCDFNSHVRAAVDQARWRDALVASVKAAAAELPGRVVTSVFFGGGTPSLMPVETVAAVIDAVAGCWAMAEDVEITLEGNPTSIEAERFRGYRLAGVNRVSMGIQALNDADLRALGRMHSVAEALAAFDVARGLFDRVSFDLIYARQGQGLSDWEAELQRALELAVDHLSLYQLTIEDGTRFGEMAARGMLRGLPGEDLAADLYALTQALCEAEGMPGYEISNHARAGSEGRHNLTYWRSGDYVGIGPGAHGRLTIGDARLATATLSRPEEWLDAPAPWREVVSATDQGIEMLLMGLRLREGINLGRYERVTGLRLDEVRVTDMVEQGFCAVEGSRLRVTDRGRPLLNAVLKNLILQ